MDTVKTAREIQLVQNVNDAVTISSAWLLQMTVSLVSVTLWAQCHYSAIQQASAPVNLEWQVSNVTNARQTTLAFHRRVVGRFTKQNYWKQTFDIFWILPLQQYLIFCIMRASVFLCSFFRPCQCSPEGTDPSNTQCNEKGECSCKRNVIGAKCTQCKTGFYGLESTNPHGCKQCFCYGHSSVCEAAMGYTGYNISNQFSSGREGWTVINEQGTCYNSANILRV